MTPNDARVGLCTIANRDADLDAVLDVAAACDCDGIELWGKEPHLGDGSRETCEAIRAAAERRGLAIPVYGSYLRPGTDAFADEVDRELRTAADLGASLIRVWAGAQEYQERTDDHWNRTVGDLKELGRRAAKRDVGVTVEKHEGSLTNATEGARALVEAVDRDDCGLNWQPLFGLSAEDLLAEARELAPLSNNVHLQAVPERETRDRCSLSDAYFDADAVLSALRARGFDGYVEIEFVDASLEFREAVRRDCAFVRSALR